MNSALARYRRTLSAPHVLPLVASSLVARMPIAVLSLALVLFLREETGSYATAGAIAGAYAVFAGVLAPLQGRLVDRMGQTRVIVPLALMNAGALCLLVVLARADVPPAVLGPVAALAGATNPPVSSALRPLWRDLLEGEELLSAGYAIDAILMEGAFIVGPAVTAVVISTISTAAAVVVAAALVLVGCLWFASLPPSRAWQPEGEASGPWGALVSPGVRTLTLANLGFGMCFGTNEVVLPAFGAEHASASLPALLLALQGGGSALGGLWYGAAAGRFGGPSRAYLVFVTALPVVFGIIVLAGSPVVMALLVTLSGAVIAPLTIAENEVSLEVAPPGAVTETFTWMIMAVVLGVAAGNAAGGAIVEAAGWRPALLVAAGIAACGALITVSRRATLGRPYEAAEAQRI